MLRFIKSVARFGISTLLLSLSLAATPANAQTTIVPGGLGTLSQAEANQLGSWLGEGPIRITSVFRKSNGDTQNHGHWRTAMNGKGRTFTVLHISTVLNGTTYNRVIGGYHSVGWGDPDSGYRITHFDHQRTDFLFDLTLNRIQRQDLIANDPDGGGQKQIHNDNLNGPTWGGGHDLRVYGNLENGDANGFSYNGASPGNTNNLLALPGQSTGVDGSATFGVSHMEVFTIENETPAVPEPGSLALFLPALAAAGLLGRRRSSSRHGVSK